MSSVNYQKWLDWLKKEQLIEQEKAEREKAAAYVLKLNASHNLFLGNQGAGGGAQAERPAAAGSVLQRQISHSTQLHTQASS